MSKIIFTIDEFDNKTNNAGPKAKNDIDYFLKGEDFKVVHQYFNVHSKLAKIKDAYWTIPRLLNNENDIDELFFQYPTYSSFLMKRLVKRLNVKSKKVFFIIHDVESLRLFQGDSDYWEGEKELFNSTDGLIVHNVKMKRWLMENGVTVPMISLKIFDYDNPQEINQNLEYSREISFAGNLSKSSFLEKIQLKNSKLTIYGSNPAENYLEGVAYKGQMAPDELPKALTQNFGLVWDGKEINTCAGRFGNYMRFNNPHKVSLYLSSGLPVIIWSEAALADFVLNEKVGIAVDNLEDLDEILANISDEEYREYKQNAIKLASRLRQGEFIKNAVNKLTQVAES